MKTQRHGHRGEMACEDLDRYCSYAIAASQRIIPRMASDTESQERQDTDSPLEALVEHGLSIPSF